MKVLQKDEEKYEKETPTTFQPIPISDHHHISPIHNFEKKMTISQSAEEKSNLILFCSEMIRIKYIEFFTLYAESIFCALLRDSHFIFYATINHFPIFFPSSSF